MLRQFCRRRAFSTLVASSRCIFGWARDFLLIEDSVCSQNSLHWPMQLVHASVHWRKIGSSKGLASAGQKCTTKQRIDFKLRVNLNFFAQLFPMHHGYSAPKPNTTNRGFASAFVSCSCKSSILIYGHSWSAEMCAIWCRCSAEYAPLVSRNCSVACPVSCVVSAFTDWSSCALTCIEGLQYCTTRSSLFVLLLLSNIKNPEFYNIV